MCDTEEYFPDNKNGYRMQMDQNLNVVFNDVYDVLCTIQNMGTHGSITGKTMTRIICFDHITCNLKIGHI